MNYIRNIFNPDNNNNDPEKGQQQENPPLELAEKQERALTPYTYMTPPPLIETTDEQLRKTQERINWENEHWEHLEEKAKQLETERFQEEAERRRAYEEQQRTKVTLSNTFLNHSLINTPARQPSILLNHRNHISPILLKSPQDKIVLLLTLLLNRYMTPPPLIETTDEQLRKTQERINWENEHWEHLEEKAKQLETERFQEEAERRRAYEEQQRTKVTLSNTFLNHSLINTPARQPSILLNHRNHISPILLKSPQDKIVEARVQHIIPLTEEDEEAIATPTPIIEKNIEENLLNLVNNFNNLNIHVAQNQSIEIGPASQRLPEETQQINPNNLRQLPTMDA
ncbi:hypothetical protein Glove_311g8 [Diversispora epigaea]|uniref:Uncharacterized protein n=1 Tax=Diversispora epigaea TaxID=1348612 RepID=A0A397HRG4_9GLOM|nr:hypothetical protein Glove_311g8 [Diversispora epigaea]